MTTNILDEAVKIALQNIYISPEDDEYDVMKETMDRALKILPLLQYGGEFKNSLSYASAHIKSRNLFVIDRVEEEDTATFIWMTPKAAIDQYKKELLEAEEAYRASAEEFHSASCAQSYTQLSLFPTLSPEFSSTAMSLEDSSFSDVTNVFELNHLNGFSVPSRPVADDTVPSTPTESMEYANDAPVEELDATHAATATATLESIQPANETPLEEADPVVFPDMPKPQRFTIVDSGMLADLVIDTAEANIGCTVMASTHVSSADTIVWLSPID